MQTEAFIFARGGSKGVPGKNIRLLAGRPLIVHAIETALQTPGLNRVTVSTDDPAIAAVAREAGAEVPFMRPADLASDTAAEWLAWRHAIREVQALGRRFDTFVSVPAVCPLRASDDIAACLSRFSKGQDDIVLTVMPAQANPYYTMVELDAAGRPQICKKLSTPVSRRQDAPKVYTIVAACYVASVDFVLSANSIWDGRVGVVEIPPLRAVDIDTELDFQFAEFLMRQRDLAARE
jgi:N-acylneuraminate cytidylyltransferase